MQSAQVLDNARLQKQYLEGWQILNAISLTPAGGGSRVDGKIPFASNHPATNMWRGHEYLLSAYLNCVKIVMDDRGIKTDVVAYKIRTTLIENDWMIQANPMPYWLTDERIRVKIETTHRAALHRKMPEHYPDFYACSALMVDRHADVLVCCPGRHAPYYYPTHVED